METVMMFVAGGAIVLAILLWLVSLPHKQGKRGWESRKMQNKRGWKAPAGHYFNEMDDLVDSAGELILDMMIVAELCGINDYVPEGAEIIDGCVNNEVTTEPAPAVEEPVGTETIASQPEPVSVPAPVVKTYTPSADPEPVKSDYSGFGDSYDDSGGSDSGGGD